ncbi:amino acid ABC transporter permease [Clostridium sp. Marseille-P2415]|uniref:amino acid ABC transporter permease n=1 Tax=Clostridium sp. Marseille-P2415 TaxID=1805471 RepID=UPI0009888EEA|nr:amino acid ABC transporter permease [Clostridium sp. Marseille-P2415]
MDKLFGWERFFENIPKILPYLSVTFSIVVYATGFGVLLAILIVLVQIKKIPVLYPFFKVYVSFMRGTPMLVQLMLIYYGIPALIDPVFGTNINRGWSTVTFAYITFILNQGAFLSAIFYSAVTSIPYGQTEAGLSVGLTGFQTFRRIILPQMVRTALPPFGSDLVGLFQNSSLVFLIGVTDIMGRAKSIGSATKHVLEAYVFVVIVYIVISLTIRLLFYYLNIKLEYGRERIAAGKEEEE